MKISDYINNYDTLIRGIKFKLCLTKGGSI